LHLKRLAVISLITLTAAAAQVQSAPPAAPAPPAATAPLPISLALKAAKVALTMCVDQGYRPTVTVTDREGVARVVLVADGADPVSIIASRRKAYTAAALGVSTVDLGKSVAATGFDLRMIDSQLITFGGGYPILRGSVVIGAIAVGGADRDNGDAPNMACAQAGLAAIKNELR
jgi:glc operon protein GlcG